MRDFFECLIVKMWPRVMVPVTSAVVQMKTREKNCPHRQCQCLLWLDHSSGQWDCCDCDCEMTSQRGAWLAGEEEAEVSGSFSGSVYFWNGKCKNFEEKMYISANIIVAFFDKLKDILPYSNPYYSKLKAVQSLPSIFHSKYVGVLLPWNAQYL